MKQAIKYFVQHILIVTILMATVGFKVNNQYCPITKEKTVHFLSQPNCCCGDTAASKTPKEACCETQISYYQSDFQNFEKQNNQTANDLKQLTEKQYVNHFQFFIKPLTGVKEPYYTLPPPRSGKEIGILNQIIIV